MQYVAPACRISQQEDCWTGRSKDFPRKLLTMGFISAKKLGHKQIRLLQLSSDNGRWLSRKLSECRSWCRPVGLIRRKWQLDKYWVHPGVQIPAHLLQQDPQQSKLYKMYTLTKVTAANFHLDFERVLTKKSQFFFGFPTYQRAFSMKCLRSEFIGVFISWV